MGAQVPAAQADYKGYSTGTVIHADALTLGATRVVDAEVAYSGASVASKGTGGVTQGPGAAAGTIVNEMEQVVQPTLPNTGLNAELKGDRSFGRGSGLEVGALTTISTDVNANQILLAQRALASAPPSTGPITNEVGPVKLDPAAYASLLRGQAQARWAGDSTCVVGEELSSGLGYAADAQLLNLTGGTSPGTEPFPGAVVQTNAPADGRAVSQSRSITKLVPQTNAAGEKIGDNFGLMTETRMTIAPISLLDDAITVELLGEWVLRSVATGIPGQSYVTYGPGTVSPSTPVLRILQGVNPVPSLELTLQQLLGNTGLPIEVPGLVSVVIGEDPRAIGGDANSSATQGGDGTIASGAVDVVRIQLLESAIGQAGLLGLSGLDLRVGHMESRAQVPPGGIKCNIPVAKTADKQNVEAGQTFTYSITVTNPFADCDLVGVRVEDNISVTGGVRYSITGTNPPASATSPAQVVWNDIGPIGPKQSKTVTISIAIAANSAAGQFTNNAKATGSCATGSAQGGARITVPITGETTVVLPSVSGGKELPATGVDVLPRTGLSGPAMALAGLGLLGAALGLRRIKSSAVR